jgi:hypothetical protein
MENMKLEGGEDNKFREELISHFLWYDRDRTENNSSNNYSIVACVAAVTFLPSRCLATIGAFFIEQLRSNDTGIRI